MGVETLELFPEFLWIYGTGILPSQGLERLINLHHITASAPIAEAQVQPSSLDLRLGSVAYRVQASFLSSDLPVSDKLKKFAMYELNLSQPQVLERDCAYIAPMMEELNLPSDISGRANPKSSTGRIDVFTRLITDFGGEFERIANGYKGKLYTEIVPQTFSIRLRQGDRLNQIRLRRGNPPPRIKELEKLRQEERDLYGDEEAQVPEPLLDREKRVRWLHVDLTGDEKCDLIGYKAKKHAPVIDVSLTNCYDPVEFWDPIRCNPDRTIVLEPDEFYILASKAGVRVPPTFAAEMEPYDPSRGEFRIHYAGFFDPGFGYGTEDLGTRAVLEVRSHQVPFLLEDGQTVAALKYHRLVGQPTKIYGQGIGSSYQHQRLALSKHFKR